jgi:hypothetical protein
LIRAATSDRSMGICLWEGPSVEEVKKFVDSVAGLYSNSEYFGARPSARSTPSFALPRARLGLQ